MTLQMRFCFFFYKYVGWWEWISLPWVLCPYRYKVHLFVWYFWQRGVGSVPTKKKNSTRFWFTVARELVVLKHSESLLLLLLASLLTGGSLTFYILHFYFFIQLTDNGGLTMFVLWIQTHSSLRKPSVSTWFDAFFPENNSLTPDPFIHILNPQTFSSFPGFNVTSDLLTSLYV